MFREHPNSLTFLIDRTQDDCDTLKELVGEDDSGLLNINHILDLEKCFNFMNSIRNGKNLNKIHDVNFVKLFVEASKKSGESLEAHFTNYIDTVIFSEI